MKQLKLTEKDYQRGKEYIDKLSSLRELTAYEKLLYEWNYSEEDRGRLMALVNARRPGLEAKDKVSYAKLEAAATALAEKEAVRRAAFVYHLEKLKPYLAMPRDTESEFFKDHAGFRPFWGREKWRDKYANAPIVYGAVVQANDRLREPGDDYLPAVFVIALDDLHRNDITFLGGLADKIADLRDSNKVPDDCRKMIATLRDHQSTFCFPVGASIAHGADAWCFTYIVTQKWLPHQCLSQEGIVPFLLTSPVKENRSPLCIQISAKYFD
jgi:hypothetical protein